MHVYIFYTFTYWYWNNSGTLTSLGDFWQMFKETLKETKDKGIENKHSMTFFKLKLSFCMFIRLSYLQIMIICKTVFALITIQGHFASMREAKQTWYNFILQTNFTLPLLLISKFHPVHTMILETDSVWNNIVRSLLLLTNWRRCKM